LIALTAMPMARFYDAPKLATVLWVLALNFLLIPFAAPRLSLLRREMAFPTLFRIIVGAAFLGPIVSISTAASGLGPLSLALGSLAMNLATVVLALWLVPRRVPFGLGSQSWHRVFGFGIRSSAAAFVTQLGMNAGNLIIGRALGFTALGLYSRAQGLVNLFSQQVMSSIASVAFPAYAQLIRSGRDTGAPYLRTCGLITGIAWPFFAFLGLMAHPIIQAMFGDQWAAAVPLVRILAVGGLIYHALPLAGPLLVAAGRIDLMLRGEVVIQGGRIVLLVLAAFHGLEAVCLAQVVTYALYVLVYRHYLLPILDIRITEVLKAHRGSAMLMVCTMIGPVLVAAEVGLEPERSWFSLFLAAGLAAVGWITGVFAVRHPLCHELQLGYAKVRGFIGDRNV